MNIALVFYVNYLESSVKNNCKTQKFSFIIQIIVTIFMFVLNKHPKVNKGKYL